VYSKQRLVRASGLAIVVVMSLGWTSCSRSSTYYIDRGDSLLKAGKFDEAVINFRKAVQKDQSSAEANYRLGLAELKRGDGAGAYEALSRAEQLAPDRQDVTVELADLVLAGYVADHKRPARLFAQLNALSEKLMPKDPFDGLRLKGSVALTDGKATEAAEFLEKANALQPLRTNIVPLLVEALFKQNRFSQGETLGHALIEKNKGFQPMYDMLYARYMAENRVGDAETLVKAKQYNNPTDKDVIIQLAAHYHRVQKEAEMRSTLQRLLDNPKNFPTARLDVGNFYVSIGNPEEGMRQFQAGLSDHPKDTIPYQKNIINILVTQRKTDEALDALDNVIRAQPNDLGSRALRAELWLNSGRHLDQALREFEDLVKRLPGDQVLRFNLGRAFMAQGKIDDARTQFIEAAKQKPSYVAPRVELAGLGETRGDYAATLKYANEILASYPQHPGGRLWHCIGLIGTGARQQARAELNSLMNDFPQSSEVQFVAARLDMSEGRYVDAEVFYRKLYKAGERDLRALQGIVAAETSQKKVSSALQLIASELKQAPNSRGLHSLLASTASQAGNSDLAAEQYQWIIANNPKDVDAHLSLSALYQSKGDSKAAIAMLQDAKKLDPQNVRVNEQLAYLETSSGQMKEAIADYRRQLTIKPDDPVSLNNLAYLIAENGGNLDEAMEMIAKAEKRSPKEPGFADTLGWIYVKKNMNDAAVSVLTNLARKYPEIPEYHYHLGVALLQKGDKKAARAELQQGLAKQPPKDVADKIRQAIATIG
jgi:tetratricopeptide (TPR) repeat protein